MKSCPELLRGDLLFTSSPSWIGRAIRWAETGKGEAKARRQHGAVAGVPGIVVEALIKQGVVAETYTAWKRNQNYEVWRNIELSGGQRIQIAKAAQGYIGRKYGYLKLAAHLIDGGIYKLTGWDPYFARRLCFMDDYPICTWVCAWSHAKGLGMDDFYGLPLPKCSPDTMLDHLETLPFFRRVYCTEAV